MAHFKKFCWYLNVICFINCPFWTFHLIIGCGNFGFPTCNVLKVRTCTFTSMIINVMFIVYCYHCVVIGYLGVGNNCKFRSILHLQRTLVSMMLTSLAYGAWAMDIGYYVKNFFLNLNCFFMNLMCGLHVRSCLATRCSVL